LDLKIYQDELETDLYEVTDPGGLVASLVEQIVTIPQASRSTNQKRFLSVVQTYSAFVVGLAVHGLPMAMYQKEGDGKATFERAPEAQQRLLENLNQGRNRYLQRVRDLVALLDPSYNAPVPGAGVSFAVGVPLGLDPVTGV